MESLGNVWPHKQRRGATQESVFTFLQIAGHCLSFPSSRATCLITERSDGTKYPFILLFEFGHLVCGRCLKVPSVLGRSSYGVAQTLSFARSLRWSTLAFRGALLITFKVPTSTATACHTRYVYCPYFVVIWLTTHVALECFQPDCLVPTRGCLGKAGKHCAH